MTEFIIGAIVGGAVGLFVGACCVAAGREDETAERHMEERENVR